MITKQHEQTINRLMLTPYVKGGRDVNGCDCWGLVVILHKQLFDIEIPEYYSIKLDQMSKLASTSQQILEQIQKDFPFVEVTEPKYGDVIMFNVAGQPLHTGFVLDHKHMLHTSSESGATMESYEGRKWQKRIAHFWRHKLLPY